MAEFDWANYDWGQGTPGLMARPKNDAMSMGLLAAGLGVLANNRGNYGKLAPALGAGGLAGLSTYQNMMQMDRQSKMDESRLGMEQQRQQLLSQQMEQARRKTEQEQARQKALASLYGGGGESQLAQGAAVGDVGPTNTNADRQPMNGPTPAQLGQLAAAGVDIGPLVKLWEIQNPKMDMQNGMALDMRKLPHGSVIPQTNQQGFSTMTIPDANAPGGFRVIATPGAAEVYGQQQEIGQRANARFGSPVTVTPPGGNPRMMTPEQFSDEARGVAPAQPMQPSTPQAKQTNAPRWDNPRDADRARILQEELAKATDPKDIAALNREISMLPAKYRAGAGIEIKSEGAKKTEDIARDIDKQRLESFQKEATALSGVKDTLETARAMIKSGTLGNTPLDRLKMVGHGIGIQSPESINTANLQKIGNQLVLARGSLGAGVSVSDADRYDKAAGDFTRAQSNEERLKYIGVMNEVIETAMKKSDDAMSNFRRGGQLPSISNARGGGVDVRAQADAIISGGR